MRIALVISSLTSGGAERVLSELANAWVLRGHKVSLITLSGPDIQPFYPLDRQIQVNHLDQFDKVEVCFFRRLKNIVKRLFKLRKSLKLTNPDVILSFVDVTNIITLFASIGLGIPVVVSERIHPGYHSLPSLYKAARKLIYHRADKVVSQTISASSYFTTLPEEKKIVIPNQVIKAYRLKQERDILKPINQIISVGRLCIQKDFVTLILAFEKIMNHNQHLRLIIYGEGEERQNLERLIQDLSLTEQVFLPGAIQDIEKALCQADLFVFPSLYEGFPNALCEAMAVGLPVIASNVPGNRDVIREGVDGRLFNVGDDAQLARLMEELIRDPSQRVQLSEGALDLPNRFRQESILQKWEEVLVEVTGCSGK